MKGTEIIVSSDPKGVFGECIISGTPKPGVLMEMTTAALISGRPTMQVAQRASGAKGPVCILLPDRLQGQLHSTAYVTGARGFVYWPVAGEDLNLLLGDVAGTGCVEDTAVADLFGVETLTGKILANSAFGSAPFQAMEARHGFITADSWLFVKYIGNQA